ncbi:hypothetical protein [Streptomyces sp. 1222.5]|uniref:hypothetical protein n=1 Tax=Streptomyces sp. 1222.5 TaxID=1881026 RepID=UPI003EB7583C
MDELEALRQRVKELEDTVLYLSNTLVMHGILDPVEGQAARQMYDQAGQVEREGGRRR